MLTLVRQHAVLRCLPKTLLIAVGTATVGTNILAFRLFRRSVGDEVMAETVVQAALMLGGLVLLFVPALGRRATPWSLSLPLPARTLWAANLAALLVAVTVVVATCGAVIGGFLRLLAMLEGGKAVVPEASPLLAVLPWTVLVTAMLVLASWRPALAEPGRAAGWRWLKLGVVLGTVALFALLATMSLAATAVPLVVAVAWAARSRTSLPSVLATLPRPANGGRDDRAAVTAGDGNRTLHLVVLRLLFKWPLTWILGLPIIALLGMVLGGASPSLGDDGYLRFSNIWLTAYMLLAFHGHFLENLWRVDHLPVARAVLLRWLLVPAFACVVAGYLGGVALVGRPAPGEPLVFGNQSERYGLRVPLDAFVPTLQEGELVVTAPWGESHTALAEPVVRSLPWRVWKPWSTPEGSSAEFVAWQISRAAADILGAQVSPDLIRARYLVTDATGRVTVREPGLTLVGDGLAPARGLLGPLMPVLLGLTLLVVLLVARAVFRVCGPGITVRRLRAAAWSSLGILLVLHLGGYALLATGVLRSWVLAAAILGPVGRVGELGAVGWGGAWVVAVLLVAAAWNWCAAAFARVEPPRTKAQPEA